MFCYFLFFSCVCVIEHTQHTEREQEEALEISGRRHTQYQAQTFTITFCRGQRQRNKDVGSIWRLCMAPIVGILRPAGVARLLYTESGTKVMKRLTQRCG